MVGSAIVRALKEAGYRAIIGPSSKELDLRNQNAVYRFFEHEKPEYVFLAAARVGGILANDTYKADFLYDNLMIQTNVIHAAYLYGVKKLLFMGSSCIYPKHADQPIKEEYLLTGSLEPTNEPYAIAKIAGIKLCDSYRSQYGCNFISAMPANLYGPNDNFDLKRSHVIPALMRKMHEGKIHSKGFVEVWGTGIPQREFLHVDDLALAALFLMKNYNDPGPVNVGSGSEISIEGLAYLLQKIVGFKGWIHFDDTKPDGTRRKLLDSSKIYRMGWKPVIDLEEGLMDVYHNYFLPKL